MIPEKTRAELLELNPGVEALNTINKNKRRPLGKFSPWAWCLEPVRGCNLACWHCPVAIDPKLQNNYDFMDEKTWVNLWNLIREVSPHTRVEMANFGEPTMHPRMPEFLRIARELSPNSQIQITTNGTRLIKGEVTYAELFEAGLNIIYVDMYAPEKKHEELAEASGYEYYKYYESPKGAPGAWTYHNDPSLQFISLARIPDKWPEQKVNRGALGTFLNNIVFDSPQAKRMGVTPVEDAPNRRCSQPMKYVQVQASGTYFFCCQDAFNESKIPENVNEGVDGFVSFWFSKYMQDTRKVLRNKARSEHPMCKRCDIIFSRTDMKLWDIEMFDVTCTKSDNGLPKAIEIK